MRSPQVCPAHREVRPPGPPKRATLHQGLGYKQQTGPPHPAFGHLLPQAGEASKALATGLSGSPGGSPPRAALAPSFVNLVDARSSTNSPGLARNKAQRMANLLNSAVVLIHNSGQRSDLIWCLPGPGSAGNRRLCRSFRLNRTCQGLMGRVEVPLMTH